MEKIIKGEYSMDKIAVKNIVRDSFSPKVGHEFGNKIVKTLEASTGKVQIDFMGITSFTTLFFNAMFSELESLGSLQKVVKKYEIINIDPDDSKTYERSLKNAIKKQVI